MDKMEVEQITKIKEKEILLSKIKNLKLSNLDYKECEFEQYEFLEDELKELLKERLLKRGFNFSDLKIEYSLSHCQGDGFCFIGEFKKGKNTFNVLKSSGYHYCHKRSTNKEIIIFNNKECSDLKPKESLRAEKCLKDFEQQYYDLCDEMEKIGYDIIEATNKDIILRIGFMDFLELNNINDDKINSELFNFKYSTEPKKGFIKVCNSGNSNINGLWIEDFKIKRTYKTIIYKPFIEETNIIL